jgi:hypothetical protein
VEKGKIKPVFRNIVCIKIISIVAVKSVLKNKQELGTDYTKKHPLDQKYASAVKKYH